MLKVGDKVVIRSDLKLYEKYAMKDKQDNCHIAVSEMVSFGGKEVTIASVCEEHYRIEEDRYSFCWTDEMFEDLKSNKRTVEAIRMKIRGV